MLEYKVVNIMERKITRIEIMSVVMILLISIFSTVSISAAETEVSSVGLHSYEEIYNWTDLNDIRYDLSGDFKLMNDLDENTEGYDELVDTSEGWLPIGTDADRFQGSFDGQNYTIKGLYINRPVTDNIGLFGYVDDGSVRNVGLVDVDVYGNVYVGGLVGYSRGTVSNSYVTGTVNGGIFVGGIVGLNDVTVENSYATGDVSGHSYIGGLVGENWGPVSNSYATGNVIGDNDVGGLVGSNKDGVFNSYATGNMSGGNHVGGLVGHNDWGWVSNSYAAGNVSGDSDVGGLVGYNGDNGMVFNSFYDSETTKQSDEGKGIPKSTIEMREPSTFMDASWDIEIHETEDPTDGYPFLSTQVEGNSPIWYIHGTLPTTEITDWYELHAMRYNLTGEYVLMNDLAPETPGYLDHNDPGTPGWLPIGDDDEPFTGSFDGQGNTISGLHIDRGNTDYVGLFGYLNEQAAVFDVMLEDVDVTGDGMVGALAGENYGVINNSSATGNVSGTGTFDSPVGGLVGGNNDGTVSNCYATGDVIGNGWHVGGLVGWNGGGTVTNSYATGSVSGSHYLGGLVGWNREGTVSNSYATGSMSGGNHIGGLVGLNSDGTVSNSYATGSVSGATYLGGLLGHNMEGTVSNSYATGSVSGDTNVGGLVGSNSDGTVSNSFWDLETGGPDNGVGDGKTTAEMMTQSTFTDAGWNFTIPGTWVMAGYPYLQWEHTTEITNVVELQLVIVDLDDDYTLMNDIDASETSIWNDGAGFEPIGTNDNHFMGRFDGRNHTIYGLNINRTDMDYQGLFGSVDLSGKISNVGLIDLNVSGDRYVGGLVGENIGTVSNSYATGDVYGSGGTVGGLVGFNENGGTIKNSSAHAIVLGDSSYTGGLVGHNRHHIYDSFATGDVVGTTTVGGLVGYNRGIDPVISGCYATGNTSATVDNVGGFVGTNHLGANISESYSTGDVIRLSGASPTFTDYGGFVGRNVQAKIINCYSTGQVIYEDAENPNDKGFAGDVSTDGDYEMIGNFWDMETSGQNDTVGEATGKSTIEMRELLTFMDAGWDIEIHETEDPTDGYPFLSTQVEGNSPIWYIHGTLPTIEITDWYELHAIRYNLTADYVLMNDLTPETPGYDDHNDPGTPGWLPIGDNNERFTGGFDGQGHTISGLYINRSDTDFVGLFGFVGDGGEISNVGLVDLTVSGDRFVGGLVGHNEYTVSNSYVTGDVTGDWRVGGLVGSNLQGTISNSYATGSVSSGDNMVGGLVGANFDGTVSNSYATGNVSGVDNVGGLGGSNSGTVSNSYAAGNVSGDERVGGLVGDNSGTVSKSYAAGNVSGDSMVGGLIGWSTGWVSNSFYDMETTGQSDTSKGEPKTTAEMKDVATFTDLSTEGLNEPWDFFGDPYDDEGEEDIWAIDKYETFNDGYPFFIGEHVILTVNMVELGTIYIDGEEISESPYQRWYNYDTELELLAEPKPGFEFVGWQGDIESEETEIDILLSDHLEITAVFELEYEPMIVDIYPGQDESVSGYGMVFSARLDHPGEIDIENARITLLDTGLEFEVHTEGNLSQMNMPFTMDEGEYSYEIYMVDDYGYEHYAVVSFYVDNTAPQLEITSPVNDIEELTYEEDFTIEGSTEPGASLWINGVSVDVDGDGNFSYETSLIEGLNTFNVVAEDQAENRARTTVYALYLPQIPEILETIAELEDGIEQNRDNITALQEELEALDLDLGQLTDRVDALEIALEENVTALENAILENRTDLIDMIDENITAIESELSVINDEIDYIHTELEEIGSTLADLKGKIDANRVAIEDLEALTEQLDVNLSALETEFSLKLDALGYALDENATALEDAILENRTDLISIIDANINSIDDELASINEDISKIYVELENYVTFEEFVKGLEDYLTDQEINDLLEDYVKSGDLLKILENYLTEDEIEAIVDELSERQETIDVEQDDSISMSQNIGIIGFIIALLALIIAIFSVTKKGGKETYDDDTIEQYTFEEETTEDIEEISEDIEE